LLNVFHATVDDSGSLAVLKFISVCALWLGCQDVVLTCNHQRGS
jgi:hypothetical protein